MPRWPGGWQRTAWRCVPYAGFTAALAALPAGATVLVDPARTTVGVLAALPAQARRLEAINPSTLAKSRKTDDELVHVRAVMEQDGAALCEFFAWFGRPRLAANASPN